MEQGPEQYPGLFLFVHVLMFTQKPHFGTATRINSQLSD